MAHVLHHVPKGPEHLKSQRAVLFSKLKELVVAAPPLLALVARAEPKDGHQKALEGDWPVYFISFEEESVT